TTRPSVRLVVLAALAALVALFALLPLLFMVAEAAQSGGSDILRLVFRARVAELLGNTLRLVVVSTLLCGALGASAAWLVERTTLPGRRVWGPLLAAPLAVPAFVSSYGWVSLTPAVQGYAGAVLIVTLSYYPLVYLPVAAALRGMDPALEETARSLGHGPLRAFLRVVLPQLRPALGGGMLIVALHELAEFGAFQMLRFSTFTTAIYAEYQSSFDGPAANLLAAVLVVACLLLLMAELRLRGAGRYSRLGPGSARTVVRVRLGRAAPPAFACLAALLALALGVPVGSLIHWLVIGSSAVFPIGALASATVTSLGLGLAAAVVTTLLALPVALLAERHRGRLAVLLERSTYVAHALPGIVIALSLVFVAIHFAQPLYQSTPLLVAGYAILFLPMAMVGVRTGLAQTSPALTEAARALGNRPTTALRRVTLPLVAPGLGAAVALVFLMVATELTTTLLLAPIGTQTLATQVWSETGTLSYAAAAPYAALMVLISAPAVYLLTRNQGKRMPYDHTVPDLGHQTLRRARGAARSGPAGASG
ncbi:MAG: ABC transporter permease, partial [Sciscionella sp.]